ncbi:hypothetical protein F5B20DRAFT_377973 [Whalleya microplaca]|nr:hypothetical protein F5B20DRAFT_377973 [Whalleya microplaca]
MFVSIVCLGFVLGTQVLAQKATSWPPSNTIASSFSEKSPVSSCKQTSEGSIPQRWFSELQAEFANQNSQLSQMIQATCDSGYASSHVNYGSCSTSGTYTTCKFTANTPFYTASYTAIAADGKFSSCLQAPFYIQNHCSIAAGGGSESSIGGEVASNFNGAGSDHFESYTFTIKPNLPFPSCNGQDRGVQDAGNIDFALQAICDSNACQEIGAVQGCDRNITQYDYTIRAHRQNYGSKSDFSNCVTAMEAIIDRCYNNNKGGGSWALDTTGKQASQEYYEFTFEPLQIYQADL